MMSACHMQDFLAEWFKTWTFGISFSEVWAFRVDVLVEYPSRVKTGGPGGTRSEHEQNPLYIKDVNLT